MKALVIGFPKSGTMTMQTAFTRSGVGAAHWRTPTGFVGEVMYANHFGGRPIFHGLDDYEVITQPDVCVPGHDLNYWPQLDFGMLHKIRREHPECLFILNRRDPSKIVQSILSWDTLHQRLAVSDIPGLPAGFGSRPCELEAWIENHYVAVETAFGGQRLLDFDIAAPDAPGQLGAALNITLTWWGRAPETARTER